VADHPVGGIVGVIVYPNDVIIAAVIEPFD
jgi:hypothetical protein